MSVNVDVAFQNYYSPLVREAYQKSSILRPYVRSDGKIIGTKAYFRKSDSIVANDFNKGADITYAGTDFSNVVCNLKDKIAADMVFDVDKPKFNFDEAKILANNVAKAIGRATDQIIIDDALNQTTTTPLGGATSVLDTTMLLAAAEFMNKKAVPTDKRYILHSAEQLTQLLSDSKMTNFDYNNVKALVSGEINTFMGFKFILMESRKEGGLPIDTTDNTIKAFCFSYDSVGLAISRDITSRTDYIPNKVGTQIISMVQMGAVNIRDEAIIPLITKMNN